MKRRMVAMGMVVAMVMAFLTGCAATETTESGATTYTVGISQFAEHGSLDNCREGFLAGLAEAGIVEGENLTVIYDNAQTDTGTASTIAESFVSQKVDLICAIATPSAMSAYNACLKTSIPVVYTAVSDPVSAGLANEDGSSVGNITGSAEFLTVAAQLAMIRALHQEATKIGILYTTSETNSISTIATYEALAASYGFEIVTSGITSISEVELAAASLVSKVDCISNLTDNTVVEALQTVLAQANAAGIPVFGSEIEQVKNGCLAAMGLDYYELGKATGLLAAKILLGEATAEELSYISASEACLYVNTKVAENIGFVFEEDYLAEAEEIFDEITLD